MTERALSRAIVGGLSSAVARDVEPEIIRTWRELGERLGFVSETKIEAKKYLTAEEIIAASDIQVVELDVPEWGGTVRLRSMDALAAAQYLETAQKNAKDAQVQVLLASAVDGNGMPLFKDQSVLSALRKKSLKALMRVQGAAMDLNGLRNLDSTVEAAKND